MRTKPYTYEELGKLNSTLDAQRFDQQERAIRAEREIERLKGEVERLKEQVNTMRMRHNEEMREAARDARDAAAEARWQSIQGDDYGSY